jgi:chromate transporter
MILIEIFWVFLRIGLFAVGGAYSFLPLLQKEIVESKHWLTKAEFLDILGMVKIFPGAISIKFATYTGYKLAGVGGAAIANLANLAAPAILIFVATSFYTHYKGVARVESAFSTVQIAVFAMILAVAFQTVNITSLVEIRNILIMITVFCLFMFTKVHPALIIVGTGILGALLHR